MGLSSIFLRMRNSFLLSIILTAATLFPAAVFACTSAIIAADANPYGRPILWKHRDTSTIDNKVEYIPANQEGFGYVALFNAADALLREAWMGMNDAGFAVMNTASYNIKDDRVPAKDMDKEGILMTRALRTCRTVDDFRRLLDSYPRPMGVEANFGVIDAFGNGAYFETNNHSYVIYDLADAPNGVLIRTNYSHSGRPNEGYGHVREANANCLICDYARKRQVTPEVLTEVLSRTFYNDQLNKDYTLSENKHLLDQDYIPRFKSTATIAIEGCHPVSSLEDITPAFVADQYIMWTGIGYPPVSEIRAVRCKADGVPLELRGILPNGHSPLCDEAKQKRNDVFAPIKSKRNKYIDLSKLYNAQGTGYAQEAIKLNSETYRIERLYRDIISQ